MKHQNKLKALVMALFSAVSPLLFSGTALAATPTLVWSRSFASSGINESSPMPVNIGGSTDNIVVGSLNGNAYMLDGATGNDVAGWPKATGHPIESSASSADVDHDGHQDIYIGSGNASGECAGGGMFRFKDDGTQIFKFIANDGAGSCPDAAVHPSAALGDINRDGYADITFGALGLKAFSAHSITGGLNPGWPYYWDDTQFASPALADLDGDGVTDAVLAGDSSPGPPVDWSGGFVRALRGDGSEIWEYKITEIVRSSPSIGDVNGDGIPDVVFGAGNFYSTSDSTKIFVLNGVTGALEWSRDLGAQTLASPTLADFNGDGRLDIAIGLWAGTNQGQVYVMNGTNGSNMTGYPRSSGGGAVLGQLTTADLNGDGKQDLVVPTGGGIFAYDGNTGTNLWGIRQGFASYQNSPLIRDLDGNGQLDIVISGWKSNGTQVVDRFQFPNGDPAVLGGNGWPMFRLNQRLTGSWTNPPLELNPPTGTAGQGYRLSTSDGAIFTFGEAQYYGSANVYHPSTPVVTSMSTPTHGYWQVTQDGGLFSFGDAQFYGSANVYHPNQPVVAAMATPTGHGYWLVTRDGGLFSFGDAQFYGSANVYHPNQPIVSAMATSTGHGYWLVTADGGLFSFGDAQYYGGANIYHPTTPIVSALLDASGNGYWMVTSDGGIFTFGDAPFYGGANIYHPTKPVVGMSRADTGGYWITTSDGGIFTFNAPYHGGAGGRNTSHPIVNIATQGY